MAVSIPIIAEFNPGNAFARARKEFAQLETSAQKAQFAISKAAIPATAALTGLATAAFKAANKAGDLQEEINKTNVVFGKSSGTIQQFSQTAATALGQSQTQALKAAGTFGVLGKAAGLTDQNLAKFSTDFTILASDLASFNNTSVDEAINALGSALRGEAEPIRRFGVLLDDATLKNKAFSMGLIDSVKSALTPQQKSLAAQAVILEQTSDAQGDFARTSDSAANSQKILKAKLDNATTNLGKIFLPILETIVPLLSKMADFVGENATVFGIATIAIGGLAGALLAAKAALVVYKTIAVITTAVNAALAASGFAVQISTGVGIASAIAGAAALAGIAVMIGKATKANYDYAKSTKVAAEETGYLKIQIDRAKAAADQKRAADAAAAAATEKAAEAAQKAAEASQSLFKATKNALKDAKQGLRDYAKTLADTVRGYVSLTNAVQTADDKEQTYTDALADRTAAYAELNKLQASGIATQEQLADAAERVAKAEQAVNTAQSQRTTYAQQFRDQIAAAKKFGSQLQTLIGQGLSRAGLAQLMNLGPVAGSQVAGEMITGAGGMTAASLSADLAGLDVAGSMLGDTAIAGDMSLLNQAGVGRTGNNVYITVQGGDPQQVVEALRRYMKINGAVPIKVTNK